MINQSDNIPTSNMNESGNLEHDWTIISTTTYVQGE